MPKQIVLLSVEEVPYGFHARYDAVSKIYDYFILPAPVRSALRRNYSWHITSGLDRAAMREALSRILGEHDFAGFQSTGSSVRTTVRRMLTAELTDTPEGLLKITLEANGFLRHMVRAVAGTLVLVGQGRIGPDDFEGILRAGDRSLAGPTAPARDFS